MAKKNSGPVASYIAKQRVRFDGSLYEPGETIDLPESEAVGLVAAGAVEPAPPPAEPAKK